MGRLPRSLVPAAQPTNVLIMFSNSNAIIFMLGRGESKHAPSSFLTQQKRREITRRTSHDLAENTLLKRIKKRSPFAQY